MVSLSSCIKVIFIGFKVHDDNWRAKRALSGEVDGKLRIAAHARVPNVHNLGVESARKITDST